MNEQISTTASDQSAGDAQGAEQGDDSPERSRTARENSPSLIQRLGGLFRSRNGSTLRDDLTDALSIATQDGTDFSPGERAMLNNILRLREVRVEDVMVPRADIEGIEISTTLGELMVLFEQSGHSRMPVYGETLDDPRGMIHIRDVVAYITKVAKSRKSRGKKTDSPAPGGLDLGNVDLSRSIGELSLMRPLLFVPPSMLASDLMAKMQAQRIQMALVIDEYGGTDGLASLEDIVEMVVGDIEDEHDEEEPMITQTGEGSFVVDARAEIDDVAKTIGSTFKAGDHTDDVYTIGGMIFNTLGRVPTRGEVVQAIPGYEFHVLDADPRRVKRVRIVQSRAAERRRRTVRTPEG